MAINNYRPAFNTAKEDPNAIAIEISKENGITKNEAIKNGSWNIWTLKRIKGAFNFGKGTLKDFKKYMDSNKPYCYFERIL